MKTTRIFILRSTLFVWASVFALGSFFLASNNAYAQTATSAASGNTQATGANSSAPILKPVARITQKIDETKLVALPRSVHPAIRSRAAIDQGVVADSQRMNNIVLDLQRSPEQETALRNLLDAQQTKNSPNYHAWLTPAQFAGQFGIADADIQTVTNWLAQKGFTDVRVQPGSMFIEFSGTAGLVRNAFHTELHSFLVNGQKHYANVSDPQIPAALAPVIAKVHSLHDFRKKSFSHLSKVVEQAKAKAVASGANFTFANVCGTGGTQPCAAVGPADLATIYNIPATVAGSPAGQGQTVAIVARSNIAISDINQFGSAFGIPNLANFSSNNIIVNGPDPGIVSGDDEEATLDVDMVGSAAPNANILLVVNAGTITGNLAGLGALADDSTDGVDQSALYIVTNNLAPVMSESFGSCEEFDDTLFDSTLWEQAAAQGITVVVSTGDSGSAGCDPDLFPNGSDLGLNVSGTASTPFNVAVGGTDFNDASNPSTYWNATNGNTGLGSAKSYIPEIPWNGTCASAATSATLNTACSSIDPTDSNPPLNLQGLIGGSGGQSSCGVQNFTTETCTGYPKPAWQSAPGVPADGVRDLPDVSLFAAVNTTSNNFYIFCLADSPSQNGEPCSLTGANLNFSGVGGTSASTPAFAGIMALVNQSEVAAGRGGRQGNANYVLYKLATAQGTTPGTGACAASSAAPNSACTFNDITQGNNSAACVGSFNGQSAFGLSNTPNCSTQALDAIGVLVEPSTPSPFSATTPAWTATAGFDLATGIGSPNVANLIANWGTVTTNFKAATPAITSPATNTVSITHGNNQSFTITVSGSGGTPTGDVALIAEPPGFAQVGVGSATLANGTATITTNMLPGDDTTGAGTPYPVIAHYAGDGTFGPADSQPINVTVNREGSTTTETLFNEDIVTGALTATTTVQYGTNYIMIVNVVGATAGTTCNNTSPTSITQIPTVPCPTGTITLKDNGQPLNDFVQTGANNTNLSSVGNLGFVEDLLIQLNGGSHPIVASYSGDNSYNPSSSTSGAFAVTAAPTQTAVTLNGLASTSVTAGANVALVANITTKYTQVCNGGTQQCNSGSNGAGPTGTVTFSSCGTASSCTVPVVPTAFNTSNGAAFATATLNTSFSTAPGAPITATFTSADLNYANCATASSTCTLTGLTLTVSGSVGAASKLAFVTQPSTAAAGVAIAPAIQVAIEDANGNIVSSATNSVTIAIGTNPGTGTLGGTVTAAAVKGVATFSNLTLSAAGAGYTLAATSSGLTGATSLAFNVLTQPAKLAFVVAPSNTNTAAPIVPALQVAVEDSNGNIISTATNSITIAIGTNPGGATLGGTTTVAATSGTGIAVFPGLTLSAAGTGYTLTASASGLTSATSPAFNILASASKLAFAIQPSNSPAGKSIAPAVQVAVEDTNGNVIGGATTPITIAIGTNPGTGTLAGTTTVNAVNGFATFSNLTVSTTGNGYTLAASATGLTGATSNTFNVTAPPSFTLSAPAQPTTLSSASGASVGTTITVTPSGGFTGTVAVAASALPPGVTCPNSPVAISVTGATAVNGTLTCQVTAHSTSMTASNFLLERDNRMLDAHAIPAADPASKSGQGWWALSAGTGFAAILLFFIPGGRKRLHAALGLGLVCLLTLTLGCNGVNSGGGGGGGGGGLTATTTAMTVNADTSNSGMFTFSVTVTGGTPTGMVQLFDGATAIGAAVAVSGGTATPTAPALAVGTHAISAHYAGDSTTKASQSGTLNLTSTGNATFTITGTSGATTANTTVNIAVQ